MVVVGLITCARVVLGKGAKVLIGGSAEGQGDKREDGEQREESGVVEEIRRTHQMTHEI